MKYSLGKLECEKQRDRIGEEVEILFSKEAAL